MLSDLPISKGLYTTHVFYHMTHEEIYVENSYIQCDEPYSFSNGKLKILRGVNKDETYYLSQHTLDLQVNVKTA